VKSRWKDGSRARAIVNDQIVGRIGECLAAPVGTVALIDVPAELIAIQPDMAHMAPGISHGCLLISDCSERSTLANLALSENRLRFALLAVLYGWMWAGDHQFIYRNVPPQIVYSVDHGHFFGQNWNTQSLQSAPPATMDTLIATRCPFTRQEVDEARTRLGKVGEEQIAQAVAMPPDDWGICLDERLALATYLAQRRDALLAAMAV